MKTGSASIGVRCLCALLVTILTLQIFVNLFDVFDFNDIGFYPSEYLDFF